MTDHDLLPPARRPDLRRLEQGRYPFVVELQTRWGDMDALRHLNNASLMRYYEEARIRFMGDLSARTDDHLRGLVGAVYVDYLRPAYYPEPLMAAVAVGGVGRSSLRILQALFQGGQCVGVADVTVVHMDHGRTRAEAIPDHWRPVLDDVAIRTTAADRV